MKLFAVPVMIILMLTQSFSKWMIVLEYRLNSDYIAQHLCVNKSRPVLHCKGKCQMMKKMAEDEKQDNNVPVQGKNHTAFPTLLLFLHVDTFQLRPPGEVLLHHFSRHDYRVCQVTPPAVFHPPLLA